MHAALSNAVRHTLISIAALTALAAVSPSRAQTTADPFAGDDRFSVKRSVHSVTAPVRDLLADLTRQSGIRFFADEAVMDDPVTVIAHNRPLSETLRVLSDMSGYLWEHTGTGKTASYTLRLGDAARKEQDAARVQRVAAATNGILRENQEFSRLIGLSETQRMDLLNELPTRLAAESDPARTEQLRTTYAVLMEMTDSSGRHYWSPTIRALLRTMPRTDVDSVLKGGTLCYSWPKLSGCREFPPDILQQLLQIGRSELNLSGGYRGEMVAFRLRFVGVGARQPYLNWHLNIGQRTSQFQSTSGFMGSIPSAWAMSAIPARPASNVVSEDWKSDAVLNQRATLKIAAAGPVRGDSRSAVHRLGEALDLLDKTHPLDVIADGYWSANLPGFNAEDAPVGDILDRLAKMTARTWRKDGGFIVIKSRDFSLDRDAEPPATAVRRWMDAADRSYFSLEDLSEVATLPDAQLATLQDMAMRGEFPVLYSPLHSGRPHLRLWAALKGGQRQKAQNEGLAYKDLDPSVRLLFVFAATDPAARQLSNTPAEEDLLVTARLRVATHESPQWKIKGRPGVATWNVPRVDPDNQPVSREEAWKRFKQLDDTIKLEEVQPVMKIGVSFSYESEKGAVATTWVELPPRWGSAANAVRSGTR